LCGSPRAARAVLGCMFWNPHIIIDGPKFISYVDPFTLETTKHRRNNERRKDGSEYSDGSMTTSARTTLPQTRHLGADDTRHNTMGDAGITTFPEPDSRRTSDPATDTEFEKDRFNEKEQDRRPSDVAAHSGDEDIVWRYLTFETEVPPPSSLYPSVHPTPLPSDPHPTSCDHGPAPEPPDLAKYTNPFDWPETRKNYTIWVACIITALTAYSAGSYSPGIGQMTEEWHVSNVAALVGITTFTSGKFHCISHGMLQLLKKPRLRRRAHGSCAVLRDQRPTTRLYRVRSPLRPLPALHRPHALLRRHASRALPCRRRRLDLLDNGRRRRRGHLPHRAAQHAHGALLRRRPLWHRPGSPGLWLCGTEHNMAVDLLPAGHHEQHHGRRDHHHLQRNPVFGPP
jgi:hypothetical protein